MNVCARIRAAAHGGQTLIGRATYDLVRDRLPEGVRLRDLGVFRLRDVERAQRVFQVLISGLPDAFPPLAATCVSPGHLPVELTEFIGRRREVDEVTRLKLGVSITARRTLRPEG